MSSRQSDHLRDSLVVVPAQITLRFVKKSSQREGEKK